VPGQSLSVVHACPHIEPPLGALPVDGPADTPRDGEDEP
jgi:hypothetical protein